MKTLLNTMLFALILGGSAITQAQTDHDQCGSGLIHDHLLENDAQYARFIQRMDNRLLNNSSALSEREDEVLIVPTVVHIIHTGEPVGQGSNITDEQVFSAIVALNEDFRKIAGSNGDGAGVDTGIEFCLASRDPQDNSSNGIVRVDGSVVPDYAEMGISATNGNGASESAVKALSTWPKAEYCNIWIVNEIEDNDAGNGIQGYAYFPTSSNLDGIVVLHNVFGTVGNLKPSSNMNRTTTHEAGHYLGLYHTFHNTTNCSEANCETGGDRVCDTPPTVLNNSCSSPECSGTQQVENYMDYTSQTCRDMFSQGQSDRMRATYLNERSSLESSLGCVPVTDLDAGITNISSPTGSLCNNQISPVISVSNFGSNDLQEIVIEYGNLGSGMQSYTWTGILESGLSTSIELPAYTSGNGSQTFSANVVEVNNSSDENATNDSRESSFIIASGASISLVFTVDYFGSETTWEITDDENSILAEGGPYVDNNQGMEFTENVCLAEGCYTLTVFDEYGDGMNFTTGNYVVYDGSGNELASDGGNFGHQSVSEFCLEVEEVEGTAPTANFSVSADEICPGDEISLNNLSSGESVTYSWTYTGANVSGSAQSNPQNISFDEPGNYTVTLLASNQFGSDSHSMSIVVHDTPSVNINSSNITCFGESDGAATALATGNGPFDYLWNNGSTSASLSNLSAGAYSVSVESIDGCSASTSVVINEPEEITITASGSPTSCYNNSNGALSANASGGNSPYTFSWSNGSNNQIQTNVASGEYTVTLTDASGCEAEASTSVISPAPIELSTSLISPESCEGADGSVSLEINGGVSPINIDWNGLGDGQLLSGLSTGSYDLTVTDANGCTATTTTFVPIDCQEAFIGPSLTSQDCGASNLLIEDEISCEAVENAEMYLWRFENQAANILTEEYTMAGNNTFQLSNILGLIYNVSLDVRVKVLVNGEWSAFGEACIVNMADEIPTSQILSQSCGVLDAEDGILLECENISGADVYRWHFNSANGNFVLESFIAQIAVYIIDGFIPGEIYSISVSTVIGEMESAAGEQCGFAFGTSLNLAESDANDFNVTFYPNPGNGEKIIMDFDNLSLQTDVIDCELYDTNAKLIEKFTLYNPGRRSFTTEHHFKRSLSAGMYFLQYNLADTVRKQKMIVR